MNVRILLFVLSLAASGCTTNFVRNESRLVAERIGSTEEEIATLAREASVRHKRSIAWIRTSVRIEGGFDVGLSDQPGSAQGIAVVFRKTDGHWQEDPTLEMPWWI